DAHRALRLLPPRRSSDLAWRPSGDGSNSSVPKSIVAARSSASSHSPSKSSGPAAAMSGAARRPRPKRANRRFMPRAPRLLGRALHFAEELVDAAVFELERHPGDARPAFPAEIAGDLDRVPDLDRVAGPTGVLQHPQIVGLDDPRLCRAVFLL